ncbi:MAG: DNA modification methylase [Patescibacteria group bacterium]|nr:ParB N-terminal domain-containing protein [Patescibacteria group bacterium]MDE2015349.1 DNA modification methylase [Patescibacteria group bacterium]
MKNTMPLHIEYVPAAGLKPAEYNPRKHDKAAADQLKESISRFGVVDPLVVNCAPGRENVVIGGHFRLEVLKELGMERVPAVYINIPDIKQEQELNIRLNKNTGEFDWDLLANFSEEFLKDVGFSSEEMDEIFGIDEHPEEFDLAKELQKLQIGKIETQKGDLWQLGEHRLMCGDSTVEADVLKLMGEKKADMCFTDPPYILDYLHGKKRNGKATEGFGLKRDRKYLETDELPENFSDLWMANVAKIQKPDFSIIIFEHPKNLRTIWNALEKHWKYRNTIAWHLPNRVQGFAAKYKFFNKNDIAVVGTQGEVALNLEPESDSLFQEEYENALYATSGKPQWEGYEKGKKICPTDFIEYVAADEKSSGQGIIFGTKPIQILIPYLKVLTKRDDIVIEPFGGSGSTLIACEKMKRRCRLMEKSPVYAEVIKRRFEKLTGLKATKINE